MAFKCDKCDAGYPLRMSLLNHIRLKHGNAKQFACQHCVYSTTKRGNYEQHVRSQHEKVKEICGVCGKGFSDISNLNKHVRQFHSVLEKKDKESVARENVNKRKATDILENQPKRAKDL